MSDHKVRLRNDNGKVVLILDGKGFEMPWEKADEIARGLTINARKAEEYCKANQIIADNALMQRAGANFGLSDHPKIIEETIKTSLYDRTLRRFLPRSIKQVSRGMGDIETRGVVGAPTLSKRRA